MLNSLKKFIYWSTLIGPMIDACLGAYRGVKEVVLRYSDTREYLEELEKFHSDNQDITFKSMVKDLEKIKRKKGKK